MTILNQIYSYFHPVPPSVSTAQDIFKAIEDLREERAKELALMLAASEERVADLVTCCDERDRWKKYAHCLEKLCLGAGVRLPPSPEGN